VQKNHISKYYQDFKNEALSWTKWFSLQAVRSHRCENVRQLMTHPAFTLKIPTARAA